MEHFSFDTPVLAGSAMAWLSTNKARWRVVSSNWDVKDLVARKDEMVIKDLLRLKLGVVLGKSSLRKRKESRVACNYRLLPAEPL